ncbi:Putative pectate lyase A [Verticillium dahliae VDG1]|nr:Putative pectate lyase A [Verticillium dahliae VDG1]
MIPSRFMGRPLARPNIPVLRHSQVVRVPRSHVARFPLGVPSATPIARAWDSTLTGKEKSGHITAAQDESILFFDNLFPLKLSFLFRRPWQSDEDIADLLKRFDSSSLGLLDPINLVKKAIPQDIPMKVTEILPRLKDGGVFVKVSHGPEVSAKDLEDSLTKKLEATPIKPWFNPFRGVKLGLVKGAPWLEDLYRFPKSRLKVEFTPKDPGGEAVELSQEELYSLFRKYGKIAEITSQPNDSKVLPKFAYLDFALIRDAIMARNCLHGYLVGEALGGGKSGTKLRLSYEQKVKAHSIWNWISSHPRLVIPIVLGLVTAITVAIFDPIRHSDTFIVVQGPRGSGKKELVLQQTLEGRKNVLVIDCKPIVEARGEGGTIKNMATAVGYRPVFSWANSMSSLVDLAVQSTTGVKSGFSETLETQVVKILHTAASALKDVSLASRHKNDKDADLSDDAYLDAHPEKRPVVVIDNFLHKNEESSIIYEKMAQWAAMLVQNNVAHVIFLTNDTSYSKSLSRVMPDRVYRQVALGDLSPDVAKKFVASRLEVDDNEKQKDSDGEKQHETPRSDLSELDDCIDLLGGRLTDLEFLARRIRGGQSPKHAVDDIINQSATEIVKMYLLGGKVDAEERKWSTEQAWYLIKSLVAQQSLRYNEVLLSDTFASSQTSRAASGELALESLTNAELISVKTHYGRPQTITAGKPMYQAAFKVLAGDPVLRAKMDLAVLTEMAKVEAKTIDKVENELALLGALPKQPAQAGARVEYLLNKLDKSQRKIDGYDKEMVGLKKVLSQEF